MAVGRLHSCVLTLVVVLWSFCCSIAQAAITRDYSLDLRASVQESPPRITLTWRNNGDGLQHLLQKKLKGASQWDTGTILSATTTSFADNNVTVGSAYEYSLTKSPAPSY